MRDVRLRAGAIRPGSCRWLSRLCNWWQSGPFALTTTCGGSPRFLESPAAMSSCSASSCSKSTHGGSRPCSRSRRAARGNGRTHLRQLKAHMRALREIYTQLAEDAAPGGRVAGGRMAARQLPRRLGRGARHPPRPAAVVSSSDCRAWPRTSSPGLPRIYALALELIGSSAGRLDAQRLQRFIGAFQSITPLTIGELWAWPSVLKLALIDHLRERGDVLAETRAHRVAADRLASAIESRARRRQRVAGGGAPRVRHPAAAALARARRDRVDPAPPARRACCRAAARRWRTRSAIDGQHQAAEQAGVANLITSLRFIGTFDWSEFFESVSLVEQVLQRDPAGVYSQMDFRSRDRYRHAVEELARPTGEAQLLLALKSVERARQVHVRAPDDRAAHVGYHLIGGGRRAFEQQRGLAARLSGSASAGCSSPGRRRSTSGRSPPARRWLVAGGSRLRATGRAGAAPRSAFVALLTVVPASELVIQLLQRAHQLPDSAAPAAAHRARRRAGVGADDGDRADAARQRARASRS